MGEDRKKTYLEGLFSDRLSPRVRQAIPLVDRWQNVLAALPSLGKRSPWRHCRVHDWKNGVVTIEVDHPGWMQLLLWEEEALLASLRRQVPELSIRAVKLRLNSSGEPYEPRPILEPRVPLEPLTQEEEKKKQELLLELENLIRDLKV